MLPRISMHAHTHHHHLSHWVFMLRFRIQLQHGELFVTRRRNLQSSFLEPTPRSGYSFTEKADAIGVTRNLNTMLALRVTEQRNKGEQSIWVVGDKLV